MSSDSFMPSALESVSFHGLLPGKKVIITGGVHGNEIAGPIAIPKVIDEFRSGKRRLLRGTVTFVPVTNPLAYQNKARIGDRNLNRTLSEKPVPQNFEDRVANVLCPLLRAHDVLVDIHSLNSDSPPFVLFGPRDNQGSLEPFQHAQAEEALAKSVGLSLAVCGWMSTYERLIAIKQARQVPDISMIHGVGTTEYMRFVGGYAVTVECGQHNHPNSPQVAYDVIIRALVHLGLINDDSLSSVDRPRVIEMCDPIMVDHPDDKLYRLFKAGEPLAKGDEIGMRADGTPIVAPYDGAIIFSTPTAELNGELGFFCRLSDRIA